MFYEAILDAIIDTLKVLPVLFLAYLLVSFFSHNNKAGYSNFMKKSRKAGPVAGAFLGCVPQCGFSSLMADMYSRKEVTLGTLLAVFIATSDEAIPILIGNWSPEFLIPMLILIGLKIVYGIFFGYIVDFSVLGFSKLRKSRKKETKLDIKEEIEEHDHHDEECGHDHEHEMACDCGHSHKGKHHCCADNIFVDALKHTGTILLYIFIATAIINIVVASVGTEGIQSLFGTNVYIQILVASLVGLIPNCVSSVLLVELYMSGVLAFSAMLAGLCVGAGVGLVILFTKNKKEIWKNLLIVLLLYVFGVASGLITSLFM